MRRYLVRYLIAGGTGSATALVCRAAGMGYGPALLLAGIAGLTATSLVAVRDSIGGGP